MKKDISRRDLLKAGLITGTASMLFDPIGLAKAWAAEEKNHFCAVVCNHWSYTGIGWQTGLESCALSVVDAMEIADKPPHIKTCINLDARAYELIVKKFPEVTDRLKRYLAEGKLELIGGTYGQPMGTTVGSESNIRQFVLGRETIRKALGYEMVTFLEEEEFSHPQVPQLAAGAGYRYASIAQMDTWGRTGIPILEYNVIGWKGVDGTVLPCVPKHSLTLPWIVDVDPNQLPENPAFKKLQALGTPLLFGWEEFGWEELEHPAYLVGSEKKSPFPDLYPVNWYVLQKLRILAEKYPVKFVTLKEYLDKYGKDSKETIYLPMNAFDKWLTWGLGGDQLRILDRKVEGLLLAAELFDAAAGPGTNSQAESLEKAWKDLLASQSHDVALCEYSRYQGNRMSPLNRMEDKHNFTWGALGYNLLDSARERGQEVLDNSLKTLMARINSQEKKQGPLAATVFNPLGHDRTDLAMTGKIYPLPANTRDFLVKDRAGRIVPSQIVQEVRDEQGAFRMAELAFSASQVPSAGYDTYYLEPTADPHPPKKSSLIVDELKFLLENEFLRVTLDSTTGAVSSLLHKQSGHETIDGHRSAFPRFAGKPILNLPHRPEPPEKYDSALPNQTPPLHAKTGPFGTPASLKPQIDWIAKGPIFATVRTHHRWKYMNFETRVMLAVGRPYVEVTSRVFTEVPPLFTSIGPIDMNSGYWLSFTPAFEIAKVVRDYPLAVEATEKNSFHALTFADLLGKDIGLLLLHSGTQWFVRDEKGAVGNLLMREWESYFNGEYGWPIYSEYRHALMPHGLQELTNASRLRTAAGFTRPLHCRVDSPRTGEMPPSKSFVKVGPDTLLLSSFRKTEKGTEVRVLENEGQGVEATVEIGLSSNGASETDLVGRKINDVSLRDNRFSFHIEPWKIRTFAVT